MLAVLAALSLGGCSASLSPAFSVVRVLAREATGTSEGSAIPIDCIELQDSSYRVTFLTARHLVFTGGGLIVPRMWVSLFEQPNFQFQRHLVPTRLIAVHPTLDLAMFTARLPHAVDVLDLDYRALQLGESLTAVGYAQGDALLIDEGIVSSLVFYWDFPDWEGGYTGSMILVSGMSGGAMLDNYGDVVAVIVGGDYNTEHGGIFLPVLQGQEWIENIRYQWEPK